MLNALRFLKTTSLEDRAAAYGNWSWALALVAAFVGLYAAATPANGAERATALSPYGASPQAVLPVPASIAFAGENA